jgi:hypothetical protein
MGCSHSAQSKLPNSPTKVEQVTAISLYNEGDIKASGDQLLKSVEEIRIEITKLIELALNIKAILWIESNKTCPSAHDLLKDIPSSWKEELDETDSWGTEFVIDCVPLPKIYSAGPDKVFGTADDIHYP